MIYFATPRVVPVVAAAVANIAPKITATVHVYP
jgi:hypothetical protein